MNKFHYLFCVFIVIIISTVIHELAHGWTAYALGDDTAKLNGRLSLNPLDHLDPMMSVIMPLFFALVGMPILGGAKPVPINPYNLRGGEWGMALVAAAGPFSNLIMSFLFYLLAALNMKTGFGGGFVEMLAVAGVSVNLGMLLFNIIPIPPLDGSRIFYAIAPDFLRNIMAVLEQYGLIVVYLLLFLGGSLLSRYMFGAENMILNLFQMIVGV